MTVATKPKRKPNRTFEEQYRSAFSEFLKHGGESALRQAYELGRRSIEGGKSLIEIASLYQEALLELTSAVDDAKRRAEMSRAVNARPPDFSLSLWHV